MLRRSYANGGEKINDFGADSQAAMDQPPRAVFGLFWASRHWGMMRPMRDAKDVLDQHFLEMRWRCLSLAADLDRVERARNGQALLAADPRVVKLREAIRILLEERPNRAEHVQMIFSDHSPPPPHNHRRPAAQPAHGHGHNHGGHHPAPHHR
jgi:hypothetical protein